MVLGPTASGKTQLAIEIAKCKNGEIISADSRQVYKHMDIGTGKDLHLFQEHNIAYHLINLVDPGEKYLLGNFQQDFLECISRIKNEGKFPVICGGTGLYLESILTPKYNTQIPENEELRRELLLLDKDALTNLWLNLPKDARQNEPDLSTSKRLIRAIEINHWLRSNLWFEPIPVKNQIKPHIIGINPPKEERNIRIKLRLQERLKQGLIEETEKLLGMGVSAEMLMYYGLEYKFVTLFLTKQLTREEMENKLYIAICQYAKRQMTWFRRMEKHGHIIHWINPLYA